MSQKRKLKIKFTTRTETEDTQEDIMMKTEETLVDPNHVKDMMFIEDTVKETILIGTEMTDKREISLDKETNTETVLETEGTFETSLGKGNLPETPL